MFVRSAYNYDMNAASVESGLACAEPTLAKQSFKEEVDINTIIKRFGLSGELPQNVEMPLTGDYEGVFDFQSAMNVVRGAQEAFAAMPASVRTRFSNDPRLFVDFCLNPENLDEARKLGLALPKPVEAAPAAAPAAGGAASAAGAGA